MSSSQRACSGKPNSCYTVSAPKASSSPARGRPSLCRADCKARQQKHGAASASEHVDEQEDAGDEDAEEDGQQPGRLLQEASQQLQGMHLRSRSIPPPLLTIGQVALEEGEAQPDTAAPSSRCGLLTRGLWLFDWGAGHNLTCGRLQRFSYGHALSGSMQRVLL